MDISMEDEEISTYCKVQSERIWINYDDYCKLDLFIGRSKEALIDITSITSLSVR